MKRSGFKQKLSKPLKRSAFKPRIKAHKPLKQRVKLRSIKAMKTELWTLVSLYIRNRDGYKCVSCGATGVNMDCGHYRHNSERNMSLGGNELWWDERNLNCQCAFYCNRNLSGNPVPYGLYLEKKYGFGILQEIDRLYRTHRKWTREEIEEKIAHYKSVVE